MGLIDYILDLAALLLWLNWRSLQFDPLASRVPATLVGTLRPAEPRRLRGWELLAAVILVIGLRTLLYVWIGAPVDWTPKLDLGLVSLVFRVDLVRMALLYSVLSFVRMLVIFYFWMAVIAVVNHAADEGDPILKLVRLHLGGLARWPRTAQLLVPGLIVAGLWMLFYPLLSYLAVINHARSWAVVAAQGLATGIMLVFSLKLLLSVILCLHLVASYVYFGSNPFWEFVSNTAGNLLRPLRRLPLRVGKLDLAPVIGLALVLVLLQCLPGWMMQWLAARNRSLWPQ